MKKTKILLTILISLLNFKNAVAVQATKSGSADVYKVSVEKVELCESGSTLANCLNPVVIGSGAKEFDIASVDAGASVGTYGNPAKISLGSTYTHIQTTLNRAVTIKADFDVSGGSNLFCKTASGNTAGTGSAFAVGTTGNSASTDETEMIMYIPDESSAHAITGFTLDGSGDSQAGIEIAMGTNITGITGVNASGTAGVVSSSHTHIQHRLALTNPFTMRLNTPKVDISFTTSAAVFSTYSTDKNEDGTANDSACAFWAGEPTIAVTLTE
tara:strand:- start:316 stop:1128 length:813 start_codon:yes stop_codon:yes gene_type:complete